ncbi:MAG: DNA mismatch repair protein MutS, partial [Firmicutes bacterium]|nr:DNA mismatch repair protein MutS [Candidatus Caballimonas caccae]
NCKDLFERDVLTLVNPGTVIKNEIISQHKNNFLFSVYLNKNDCSISWVDITTGELFSKKIVGENIYEKISDDLVKISPAEIISNKEAFDVFSISPLIEHGVLVKFSPFTESEYNVKTATTTLKEQFGISNLQVFNINDEDIVINSLGSLISYLKLTQKHALLNIKKVIVKSDEKVLMIDYNTVRNLEITKTIHDGKRYGSLLWLLDKTKTSMGARKLSEWLLYPLNNVNDINERLDGVKAFFDNTLIRTSLIEMLSAIKDIGRISGKIANGNLMPRDCIVLSNSLEILPNVKFNLLGLESNLIKKISNEIKDFTDVVSLLKSSINDNDTPNSLKDGGYIKDGFDKDLDELRSINKNSKSIIAKIESREREKTGIKNLKIAYNHVFGYYIEITNSFKSYVPYDYKRKQTLANCERYICDELKEVEEKILSSEEKSLKLENEIFNKIKRFLKTKIEDFIECSNAISSLDALISLATVAKENNYVYPTVTENEDTIELIGSRHPVVEKLSKQRFISNDCLLDGNENRTLIITGPNMAGKSTY